MAEPTTAPAAAAPNTPATPEPTPATPATPTAVSPAAVEPVVTDEIDWRAAFGDDAEVQKLLARYASPTEFGKKIINQEKAIRSRQASPIPSLPEGATPEEVAAHRKALGIPDKADAYGLTFPETFKPTETDAAVLTAFQEFMLEQNVPPVFAKAALGFYLAQQEASREGHVEATTEAKTVQIADLRNEWGKGREFATNMKLAQEAVAAEYDDSGIRERILNARVTLEDGATVALGDFAPYIKAQAQRGRERFDTLDAGDVTTSGGRSAKEEFDSLISESVANPQAFYKSESKTKRLNDLTAAINRQQEKQGRAA